MCNGAPKGCFKILAGKAYLRYNFIKDFENFNVSFSKPLIVFFFIFLVPFLYVSFLFSNIRHKLN